MGIFNDNQNNPHTANTGYTPGAIGPPGPGFKLTLDGNYDIDNKKLTKVAEGTDNSDAITKHQLDTGLNTKIDNSEAAPTPDPVAGKLIRYTHGGGLVAKRIYVENRYNDSVVIKSDDQDSDDIHLYVPNIKNYDGIAGRRRSEIMVTSTNQTITGEKTFQKSIICNEQPTQNSHLVTKAYVDNHSSNNNYLKIDGSNFMTGDLNMNEQKVKNMLDPINEQDGVNKRFLEAQLHDYLKTDGQNPMTFDLNMNNHKIINLRDTTGSSFDSEAVNKKIC